MKQANDQELRAHLEQYLQQAQQGETIVVVKNGKPIAELAPYHETRQKNFETLKEAIRHETPSKLQNYSFPKSSEKSYGVLEALLEERRESSVP